MMQVGSKWFSLTWYWLGGSGNFNEELTGQHP
jgi:hypothetical protein